MSSPDVKQSKKITKLCRQCNRQCPTACKACSCGFAFRKTSLTDSPETRERGSTSSQLSEESPEAPVIVEQEQRRTQRTRRARPHFFDSLEYGGTHFRSRKNLSSTTASSVSISGGSHDRGSSNGIRPKCDTSTWKTNNANRANAPKTAVTPSLIKVSTHTSHLLNKSSPSACSVVIRSCPSANDAINTNGVCMDGLSSTGSGVTANEDSLLYSELSSERVQQYSLVLAEINRKYSGGINFRPM